MSVDRDPNDNGGTEFSEITPEEETKNDNTSEEYQDYYEHVAKSKYIRPIAITEDVNFETMSISQRLVNQFNSDLADFIIATLQATALSQY